GGDLLLGRPVMVRQLLFVPAVEVGGVEFRGVLRAGGDKEDAPLLVVELYVIDGAVAGEHAHGLAGLGIGAEQELRAALERGEPDLAVSGPVDAAREQV